MTIANDIIQCLEPNFEHYVAQGGSLDEVDEYGFTPLIETVITRQPHLATQLLKLHAPVDGRDVTGRTPLLWAVDNDDVSFARLLLNAGANPNAYGRNGLSSLVYPVLRGHHELKHLLYQFGANLDFAQDFILGKLIGHRFELKGDVDILNAANEFIELDYEGFILEFTVAVIRDALRRFVSSYSSRHLRHTFPFLYVIMDAFDVANEFLKLQNHVSLNAGDRSRIADLLESRMLIFPAANRGHAFSFIRYQQWWAKIDRGENSLKEGSVNIYHLGRPNALTVDFIEQFLYQKQPRRYFHQDINRILQLTPAFKMPISSQIAGNCSWANVQAVVPVAYAMQQLDEHMPSHVKFEEAMSLYDDWVEWDKDRAIDECVQRFYIAPEMRRASLASMLGAVLFHTCDASDARHLERAEKILPVLTLPDYRYILQSYLRHYCVKRLTIKGNNLLKLLDDCGVNPGIDVTPIATGLKTTKKS
ncbi:MAG: Dot/Icm T4SS effector AnkH/LegA3 [Legionellaceae bacterium]